MRVIILEEQIPQFTSVIMAKFTLHNEHGDFMLDTARTLELAESKCDKAPYNCKVFETYWAKSPMRPWDDKLVEHGREVYRNF